MEEELVELARLYDRSPEVFTIHPNKNGNKLERLFFLIKEHPERPKHFFKRELYGEGYEGTGYHVLRLALRRKLFTDIRKVDFVELAPSPYVAEALKVLRDFYVYRGLHILGYRKASIPLGYSIIKDLSGLDIYPDIKYRVANSLITNRRIDTNKSIGRLNDIADKSIQELTAHHRLTELFAKLTQGFEHRLNPDHDFLKSRGLDIDSINEFSTGSIDFESRVRIWRSKSLLYEATGEFQSLVDCNTEFLSSLEQRFSNFDELVGIALKSQAVGYVNLKELEKASETARRAINLTNSGSYNWFMCKEIYTLVNFRIQDFDKVRSTVDEVYSTKRLEILPLIRQVNWRVYKGYMLFAEESELSPNRKRVKSFNIDRFMKEMDDFRDDRSGAYSMALVLRFLVFLNIGRYVDLIETNDALKRYSRRYLKNEAQKRDSLFVTFLTKVVDAGFVLSNVIEKTIEIRSLLSNEGMHCQTGAYGNEIIDYEVLWDWVLEKIKEHSYTRPLN